MGRLEVKAAARPQSRLLANIAAYSGSGVIVQGVRFVQEVALRRLLMPEIVGVIGLADAVQSFVKTLDPGILAAASRELPLLRGAGQHEKELAVRATTVHAHVLQSALMALPVAGYALLFCSDRRISLALLAASVVQVLTAACEAQQLVLQSAHEFRTLSRIGILFSAAYALGVVGGARWAGLNGILIGGATAWAAQAVWLRVGRSHAGLGTAAKIDVPTLKGLVKFGLHLRVWDYPTSLAMVVDSLIVGRLLGLEALAIYSTLRAFCNQTFDLPARIGSVVLMKIYHDDAGNGRTSSAEKLFRFLVAQYLFILPVLICLGIAGVRLLTSCVLPRYEAVVPLASILLFESYFCPTTSLMRNFWIIDKNLNMLAASGGVWAISRVALLYWVIPKMGLTGAAFACVMSAAIYYVFLLTTVGRAIWGGRDALKIGLLVAGSALYTAIATRLFIEPAAAGWIPAIFAASRQIVSMLALLSPMLAWGIWRFLRSVRPQMA